MQLKFGDLEGKKLAHQEGKREQKVKKAAQQFREALNVRMHDGKATPEILGSRCGHCQRWPWEHSDQDWVCPSQIWHVRPHGVPVDLLREAAKRALREAR